MCVRISLYFLETERADDVNFSFDMNFFVMYISYDRKKTCWHCQLIYPSFSKTHGQGIWVFRNQAQYLPKRYIPDMWVDFDLAMYQICFSYPANFPNSIMVNFYIYYMTYFIPLMSVPPFIHHLPTTLSVEWPPLHINWMNTFYVWQFQNFRYASFSYKMRVPFA